MFHTRLVLVEQGEVVKQHDMLSLLSYMHSNHELMSASQNLTHPLQTALAAAQPPTL